MIIKSISRARRYLGQSWQADYIFRYSKVIGATTIVVEKDYIDKDYLVDFSKFYSRSFQKIPSHTSRVHFFKWTKTIKELESAVLSSNNDELQNAYLGFAVIKPIKMRICSDIEDAGVE